MISADVQRAVERIIREDFPDAKIISVKIKEDVDFDGERVLKITVVFDSRSGKIDAARAAGIGRRIRPALEENDEDAFPMFYFVSAADAGLKGARA